MESEFSEPEVDPQEEIQETYVGGCTPKPKPESCMCASTSVTLMFLKMPKSSIFLHPSQTHVDCMNQGKARESVREVSVYFRQLKSNLEQDLSF